MSNTEPSNGDRRKSNNEALATIKATKDVIVDVKAALETVGRTLEDATDESRKRVTALDRKARMDRFILTALLLITLAVGINSYLNRQLLDKINGCINVSGKCYKTSQRNQQRIIQQITDQNKNGVPDHVEIMQELHK